MQTVLYLKKQRFLCRTCNKTFTAKTAIVDDYCNISNAVKQKISTDLLDPLSFTYIGKSNCVSVNTVIRVFKKAINHFQPNFDYLPECLCFDEFKSVKNVKGAMSFIFCDGSNSRILDILPDRRLDELRKYFSRYSKEARFSVKYVVCDMYIPYFTLVDELFPNAKIVLDKFHLVQNFNRAFNITRIKEMNAYNTDTHEYKNS